MSRRRVHDHVFRALADPSRRRILELLRDEPGLNASDLAARFPFSRVAVVKHVAVLERGGLVVRRRAGRSVGIFPATQGAADAAAEWLASCRPFWTQRLRDLKADLERQEPPMPTPKPAGP